MSELASPEVRLAEHADLLAINTPIPLPAELAELFFEDDIAVIADGLIASKVYEKDNPSFGRYNVVAHKLQREFVGRAIVRAMATGDRRLIRVALDPILFNGLQTIAGIQSYAPGAYMRYAERKEEQIALTAHSLGAIVLKSKVANYFARTDNERNIIREVVFGLYSSDLPSLDDPFVIFDSKVGPRFDASKVAKQYVAKQVRSLIAEGRIDAKPEHHRQCPAAGIVLMALWERAVELCVESPELFARDLAAT